MFITCFRYRSSVASVLSLILRGLDQLGQCFVLYASSVSIYFSLSNDEFELVCLTLRFLMLGFHWSICKHWRQLLRQASPDKDNRVFKNSKSCSKRVGKPIISFVLCSTGLRE